MLLTVLIGTPFERCLLRIRYTQNENGKTASEIKHYLISGRFGMMIIVTKTHPRYYPILKIALKR